MIRCQVGLVDAQGRRADCGMLLPVSLRARLRPLQRPVCGALAPVG